MSALNHAASHRLTPRNKFQTPAKSGHNDSSPQLSLKRVIGTTTLNASAIDCLPDGNIIATCSAAVVVVSQFDEDLQVTQRIFRAGPNATASYSSSSFYNPSTPPAFRDIASRQSIARDGGSGIGLSINHSDPATDSPGRVKANIRNRSANCLSLSRDGRWLAVGEVCLLHKTIACTLNRVDRCKS